MSDAPIPPEGPTSEWKSRLPRPERLARTLSAFANGAGGSLWIGVRDSGEVCGVADEALVRTELEFVRTLLEPPLRTELVRHRRTQGLVLELRVKAGGGDPVAVIQSCGARVVYLRDGASTRAASRSALRAMQRPPAARLKLDAKSRRLLALLRERDEATLPELARAARMGQRACRRLLVPLVNAGLVHEKQGSRLALTPQGHRRLG